MDPRIQVVYDQSHGRVPLIALDYSQRHLRQFRELMVDYTNGNLYVVSATDRDIILRSIACDKDVKQTPISDIMTCNVCFCKEDDDMTNAQNKMANNQIRRLPVCDNNKNVIGILTLGDLAQFDKELGKQEVCTTIENICECNGNKKNAE